MIEQIFSKLTFYHRISESVIKKTGAINCAEMNQAYANEKEGLTTRLLGGNTVGRIPIERSGSARIENYLLLLILYVYCYFVYTG